MKKIIVFDQESRAGMQKGINTLAKAVLSTLGPKGQNVAIVHSYDVPFLTHDGVTVAKEIRLVDPVEDAGAQLVREAASKTNDEAGDGTTTATALSQAIITEGFKAVDAGYNSQILNNEIFEASLLVLLELKKSVKKVTTKQEKQQIATISSANPELGELVADAVDKAGEFGVVSLNEVPSPEVTVEHTTGMEFDNGFVSAYFINDDKNRCGIPNPYILITDQRLSSQQDVIPFIELVTQSSSNFMIIAEDIEGEALALLVANKLKGNFNCVAVRAPAFGMRRKQILQDIAVLTGGVYISEDTGRSITSITLEDLGKAERIFVTKDKTQIIDGKGDQKEIAVRAEQIKTELADSKNEYDKEQIKQRLAKLTSGVVVINVGGRSEIEMRQTKFRIEDAVNATQGAIQEGIVPGGETALLKASRVLEGRKDMGSQILLKALHQPFNVLMGNSGITDGELIAQARRSEPGMGINVMTGKLTNLIVDGVIDPVKVSRSALQNSVSVAGLVLTTATTIIDIPEEKNG